MMVISPKSFETFLLQLPAALSALYFALRCASREEKFK